MIPAPSAATPPEAAPAAPPDAAPAVRHLAARIAVLVGLLALLVVAALTIDLPEVDVLRAELARFGVWAPIVFVIAYTIAVPLPVPKSIFTTLGGVAFGAVAGTVLVTTGITAGATLSFLLGRVLGRDVVDRMAHGQLAQVDEIVERHGVRAALVLRFVPVLPFSILNYACGLTAMRLRHYVIGTALGAIPGTAVMVAIAAAGARISLWIPVIISGVLAVVTSSVAMVRHHRRLHRRPAAVG